MKEFLKKCGLNGEQINMVEVFLLLYGYSTLDELLSKTNEELAQHKGWDDEIKACIDKIRANSSPTNP